MCRAQRTGRGACGLVRSHTACRPKRMRSERVHGPEGRAMLRSRVSGAFAPHRLGTKSRVFHASGDIRCRADGGSDRLHGTCNFLF
eukprot:7390013-Prymnesium_polylepis.1